MCIIYETGTKHPPHAIPRTQSSASRPQHETSARSAAVPRQYAVSENNERAVRIEQGNHKDRKHRAAQCAFSYVAIMHAQETFRFAPIGYISSAARARYDAPRQGVLSPEREAVLRLLPGQNYEQALGDLIGIERVWLLYVFHLNKGWKPRVNVPRHRQDKVGVFATRAPYRPNPIGLSCVRLLAVDGLELRLADCDILDGTPVLDIKPYLPYADSFPHSVTGWIPPDEELYTIEITDDAMERLDWLQREADLHLYPFIALQLEASPVKGKRKRIKPFGGDDEHRFILARRTWRIGFDVWHEQRHVRVFEIFSCYSDLDLTSGDDPHADKDLHRRFNSHFGPRPAPPSRG
jgi:tRNA (adenine37-N6)-methyltransferase